MDTLPKELNMLMNSGANVAMSVYGCGPDKWLCLHGFLDNAATFSALAPLLVADGTRTLYCIDLLGHGRSGYRKGMQRPGSALQTDESRPRSDDATATTNSTSYHMADWVADVVELSNRLFSKGEEFSLLGHSLGSSVAMLAAGALGPGRVQRLIMLDALGPHSGRAEDAVKTFNESVLFRARASRRFSSIEEAAAHRAKMNFVGSMSLEHASVLTKRGCLVADNAVYWDYDVQLRRPSAVRFPERSVRLFIEQLKNVPSLVILAQDGLFAFLLNSRVPLLGALLTSRNSLVSYCTWLLCVLVATVLGWSRLISSATRNRLLMGAHCGRRLSLFKRNASVVMFAGGGHHLHLSRSKEVADSILAFCKK